ncbi:MAG: hypothetical protein R6V00_01530 [Candidatus Aminicenantes bacterium]
MISKETEKLVYPKALKCFKSLKEALQLFNDILEKDSPQNQPVFYRARKSLREGEDFFKQALKNAKRLLGPLPEYVTDDYHKWRESLLNESNMLAKTQERGKLDKELLEDEFLNKLMDKDEIKKFLDLNYDSQKQGKRKIPNIKIRIVFDKLSELIRETKEKQKELLEQRQNQ